MRNSQSLGLSKPSKVVSSLHKSRSPLQTSGIPSHHPARVAVGYVEDDMMWTPHAIPAITMSINCILDSIRPFLAKLGLGHYDRAASVWMLFAA
jgi:hypothetical protein